MQSAIVEDKFILQFKVEASQINMGEAALGEFLKVGLNSSLSTPSVLEQLEKWYNWAMCLDQQYWQVS